MTYLLTHPVLNQSSPASARSRSFSESSSFPFCLGEQYLLPSLSLSIHIHLTTYYSDFESMRNFLESDINDSNINLLSNTSSRPSTSRNVGTDNINLTAVNEVEANALYKEAFFPRTSSPSPSSITSSFSSFFTLREQQQQQQQQQEKSQAQPNDIGDWTKIAGAVPVSVNLGKPRFTLVLEREMMQQIGAMAVSVCGPGGMGDDVRAAVRKVQGRKVVDLYEESFSW